MPNWCNTDYVVCGDEITLRDLENKLSYLENLDKPYKGNGFGNLWCGCLVELLGGDSEKVGCRGEFYSHGLDSVPNTILRFSITSAWSELSEFRKFLKEKLPGITDIYYYAEEPGCIYYETNDIDGEFFPNRYIIDTVDTALPVYFESLEEVFDYVYEISKIKVSSEEEILSVFNRLDKLKEIEFKKKKINESIYHTFIKIQIEEKG